MVDYVPFNWEEKVYTEQEVIDNLNNMERQAATFNAIVDAHIPVGHTNRYYTTAEADAKFRKGTTKNGDYDMIDGLHGAEIASRVVPVASIMIWGGAFANIPTGFNHCDGYNMTPNLIGKFIIGAGGSYNVADEGGLNSRTPTGTVTIATHALTIAEMKSHQHSYVDYYNYGDSAMGGPNSSSGGGTPTEINRNTDNAGSGEAHGHAGSTLTADSYDNRPAYMKLCFVKRSG